MSRARNPTTVNLCTLSGETALTAAAKAGHARVIQLLLSHGADVESGLVRPKVESLPQVGELVALDWLPRPGRVEAGLKASRLEEDDEVMLEEEDK
eukprot:6245497-Pyramimonas_sp.AAC.1